MMTKPKKVAVLGLDCALTHLIDQHIQEGHLPTFKKIFESSTVAENCLTNYPTITPPGWATLATGAWAGTHGVTDFTIPTPGDRAGEFKITAAFSSKNSRAQFIWDAADQAGKKCIVLNYPGSDPSNLKNGIMVGGGGLSVGEYRDGLPGLGSEITVCHDQLITTDVYPNAIPAKFEEAAGWTNVPDEGRDDMMELTARLNYPMPREAMAETTWYVLARDLAGDGYDTVTLSPTRDYQDAFCTLKVGQWSEKIFTQLQTAEGKTKEVFFHCKLIELSEDAEDFKMFFTAMIATEGWSSPPEIAAEIKNIRGVPCPGGGVRGYAVGWFDLDTYVEINELYSQWLGDAAKVLLTNHDWDLFYMHSHPPDWVYHAIMTDMDPRTCPDEDKRRAAWQAHLGIYETQDRMLAGILEAVPEDETLIALVSDHGATPDGPKLDPYEILVPAGLAVKAEDQVSDEELKARMVKAMGVGEKSKLSIYNFKAMKARATKLELSKTKAFPRGSIYFHVNLKGKFPEGCVEPQDYEKVQQEIIDALYQYVEPTTGRRPVALALSKQDARILGLYGDMVGDVVYAVYPEFGSQHGQILPTAKCGVGSLRGLFTLGGPGLKKNHRLERTVWLNDLVPTICYLLDLPVPEQAEGAVLYQAFEDPDFKRKETQDLKKALAEMEKKLA